MCMCVCVYSVIADGNMYIHVHVHVALFVCLTLLATFFLPSHLSFKNMYTCRSELMYNVRVCNPKFISFFHRNEVVLYSVHVHVHVHVHDVACTVHIVHKYTCTCTVRDTVHTCRCNEPRAFACTLYRYMYSIYNVYTTVTCIHVHVYVYTRE